jgi:hypothetical protein
MHPTAITDAPLRTAVVTVTPAENSLSVDLLTVIAR